MSIITKLTTYFKEAVSEMKKVVWPSKKQTTNYTLVVIGMSLGIAVFFAILDYFLNQALEVVI